MRNTSHPSAKIFSKRRIELGDRHFWHKSACHLIRKRVMKETKKMLHTGFRMNSLRMPETDRNCLRQKLRFYLPADDI